MLGAPSEACAAGDPPPAPAEGDPALRRRPHVVDHRPAVGDAFPARPADLLEEVRYRLGQHHVAGGDGEAPAQGRAGRVTRRPEGEDARSSLDPGLRRLGQAAPAAGAEPAKRRALEDPDAGALGEPIPQAERQPRRLNGRRTRVEHAATEPRRPAPLRHLIRTQLLGLVALAELATGLDRLVRDMVLGGRRGDLQVAALPVPGVHLLLRAEPADLVNGVLRGSQNSRRCPLPRPDR